MFLRELRKIARPHWFDILFLIKRSTGLSVSELAKEMGMSYMGVKQHCDELENMGMLDTWRRPREEGESGRPEKAYRLTHKGNLLFPSFENEFTTSLLDSMKEAYGSNAPEKLIFAYLSNKVRYYQHHIKGDTLLERATSFAIVRNREGFLCVCSHDHEPSEPLQIIEYHNPMRAIYAKYPATARMEENMIAQVLQCSISCTHEAVSGLTRSVFTLRPTPS